MPSTWRSPSSVAMYSRSSTRDNRPTKILAGCSQSHSRYTTPFHSFSFHLYFVRQILKTNLFVFVQKVAQNTDLCKVFGKAVRELGEREGSTLKSIEKYIRQSHTVEEETDGCLRTALKLSSKRAVDRGFVHQDGRFFRQPDRPVSFNKKTPEVSRDSFSESTPKVLASLIYLKNNQSISVFIN